ncbi:Uncharacterised protein [Serratia marcescens]|nr:Uncharacterised protein [Serratia marcescens]CAI1125093.1 Uncharacterised protein [Serratia marcescens]
MIDEHDRVAKSLYLTFDFRFSGADKTRDQNVSKYSSRNSQDISLLVRFRTSIL